MTRLRTFFRYAVAVASLALGGANLLANTVTVTEGAFHPSGFSGGEFRVKDNNHPALNSYIESYDQTLTGSTVSHTFQTFCIEFTENFNYNTPYDYDISSGAKLGGTGVSDIVSVGTAYLYSEFAKGTLAGYSFGGTVAARKTSAAALQRTIWWLENEAYSVTGGFVNRPSNSFSDLVEGLFGVVGPQSVGADGDGFGAADSIYFNGAGGSFVVPEPFATSPGFIDHTFFGVFALNLGPFDGQPRTTQDQLIFRTPANAPPPVPDGGPTIILLGVAMFGILSIKQLRTRVS